MPGTPFKCKNCNATLTWRDTPVIECEYCHEKILVDKKPPAFVVAPPGARKSRFPLLLVVLVPVIVIVVIASRKGGSKSSSSKPAVAAVPVADVEPVAPAKKPEPPPPPSIGKQVLEFGEAGTGPGQFQGRVLAVTPAGDIVVAETSTGRVQVFDASGKYQRVITLPPDAVAKQMNVHGAAANSKGQVVVSRSGDLVMLDIAAGTIASTIRGSYPDIYYGGDVDIAPDDTIYAVTDRTGDKAVRRLSAAGKLLGTLKRAGDHVAVDGVGNVFIAQWDTIEVRDAKGDVASKFSQGPRGKLSHPSAIAFDGKHLYVHDSSHVLIFDPEGAFVAELETGSLNDMAFDRAGALYTLTGDKVRKYEITLPAK